VDDQNQTRGITGTYDSWALSANLIFNLSDGPLTPFVGGGIGYTWIDTNVPNGLPTTGCWWDPWWGYVCYTEYPTKTTDAFSYQATAGLRWALNPSTFLRLAYNSQWIQLGDAEGTPRFDAVALEVGWIF
jgi:opacity protein-like surface antigen